MSDESHFTGHLATVEHRTTGGRAWCHDCGEWCYPQEPCGERRCCAEAVRSAALDPSCDHEWDEPHPGLRICDTCGQVDGWLNPTAVEVLRTELSTARRDLERWESGQRRKFLPVVESVPDGMHYAAELLRAQGTEGGEAHDDLIREAGIRLKTLADASSHLLAEAVVLRTELSEARSIAEQATRLAEHATAVEYMAQRDAAFEQRDAARTELADAIGWKDAATRNWVGCQDELERVLPVVEAAKAWRAALRAPYELSAETHNRLLAAVDALDTTTPPADVSDGGAP